MDLDDRLLALAHIYMRAKYRGIQLDVLYAENKSVQLAAEETQLTKQMQDIVGDEEFNPRSYLQVGNALYRGHPYTLPVVSYTATGNPGTSEDVLLVLLEDYPTNPFIRALLRQRKVAKFNGTYFTGFLDRADKQGRIHPNHNLYGTITGRPSSSDPNVYNIPSRGSEAKEVKAMIIGHNEAPYGAAAAINELWTKAVLAGDKYVMAQAVASARKLGMQAIYQCDYSQAELRVLAHISQDEGMLASYREGRDFHWDTANAIWPGREKEMRRLAKIGNFLMAYMGSPPTLAEGVWNSYDEEERADRITEAGSKQAAFEQVLETMTDFYNGWIQTKPGVVQYWKDTTRTAFQKGYLETVFGRRRRVGMVPHPVRNASQYEDLRKSLVNFPIQSTASDLTMEAMRQVSELSGNIKAQILLMLYDSIWSSVGLDDVPRYDELTTHIMKKVPDEYGIDTVPFEVDAEVGLNAAYTVDIATWKELIK